MRKAQEFVRRPIAVVVLLVLLGVTAHAGAIFVFTSRDAYEAFVGAPNFAYNFNALPNGPTNLVNFGGLGQLAADMVINDGAAEFLANPLSRAAFNFGPNIIGWGATITPLGGPGQIQYLSQGLGNLVNISGPGFVGFAADFRAHRFNINFVALDPFGGITLQQTTNFVVDNVIINTVPEPTTLVLIATGAGLMGWGHRRRRMRSASPSQESSPGEPPDPQ